MKPLIGIPGYIMRMTRYHELPFDANVTQQNIVDSLTDAGAIPMVFPSLLVDHAQQYVKQVDGVVIAGGADVDPLLYHEEPTPKIKNIEPERDAFELAVIKEARKQNKPILGICRGLQLLNVAYDGTLYQDLSYYAELELRHSQITPMQYKTHSVKFKEESFLGEIFGAQNTINSLHHQAIKDLGRIFEATAWAPDGVIEGIESKDEGSKIIAVQWHPEEHTFNDEQSLEFFKQFVNLTV